MKITKRKTVILIVLTAHAAVTTVTTSLTAKSSLSSAEQKATITFDAGAVPNG